MFELVFYEMVDIFVSIVFCNEMEDVCEKGIYGNSKRKGREVDDDDE